MYVCPARLSSSPISHSNKLHRRLREPIGSHFSQPSSYLINYLSTLGPLSRARRELLQPPRILQGPPKPSCRRASPRDRERSFLRRSASLKGPPTPYHHNNDGNHPTNHHQPPPVPSHRGETHQRHRRYLLQGSLQCRARQIVTRRSARPSRPRHLAGPTPHAISQQRRLRRTTTTGGPQPR